MDGEKLYTKKHLIAFIDFLGASEAIANDTNDTNLNTVNYLIGVASRICESYRESSCKNIKIKAFSDNIVFAALIDALSDDDISKLAHDLCLMVSAFQMNAFKLGILIRGGISMGNLYIDDTFVWGKALLQAYHLESKMAFYPRIIVDKMIRDLMPDCDTSGCRKHHIKDDIDGLYIVDSFSFFDEESIRTYIVDACKTIEKMKKLLQSDRKALQKLIWYENYLSEYQKES